MECAIELSDETCAASVTIFDAPPPIFPRHLVTATIEAVSAAFISIVFSGNVYPFSISFTKRRIGGVKTAPSTDNPYGDYYRVLLNENIAGDAKLDHVVSIFTDDVLCHAPAVIQACTIVPTQKVTCFATFAFSLTLMKSRP